MGKLSQKRKLTIMLAIMGTMLFASLNQTSIGTALPRIIATLGGMEYYSWAFTIYILTSAIVMTVVGKLSDIYGRKIFLLSGLLIFMLGSFLCGMAGNILMFIIFRGLQGLGAGMIFANAIASVGDLFSPKERGRWQGLMASVFGLSSLVGPVLGGFIVDNWEWQWVFWINLPVGVFAFVLIWKLFPHQPGERTKIDYQGAIYLIIVMMALLLGFSFAGVEYSWTSIQILGLFGMALLFLVLFIRTEQRVESPILPLNLFSHSIYSISSVIGFITGFTMFGTVMFIPLFVQGAVGMSATQSGLILMPMMLSWVTASTISGQITSRTGKYKLIAMIGVTLTVISMFLLAQMTHTTSPAVIVRNIVIMGLGMGIIMPTFMLIVQNALPHKMLGVVSSTTQLYRQLGGTIGVAVMGTIMANRMSHEIVQGVSAEEKAMLDETGLTQLTDPQLLLDPDFMANIKAKLSADMLPLFDNMQEHLQMSLGISIQSVFILSFVLAIIGFILALFVKEIPLRDEVDDDDENSPAKQTEALSAQSETDLEQDSEIAASSDNETRAYKGTVKGHKPVLQKNESLSQ